MKTKSKVKSLIERKLENPTYRREFDEGYESFKLEVQLLNALERNHLTYDDLAKALHTGKGNISRDLRGGGIYSATVSRVSRMAKALGLEFIPVLIPTKKLARILPQIEKLIAA